MANRQSVPGMRLGGAALRREMNNTPIPVELHRELPVNTALEGAIALTDTAGKALEGYDKYQKNQQKYKADELLSNNRAMLQNAQSAEEFDEIAKTFENTMPSNFEQDAWGKDFWLENGNKLMEAHRKDVARLKQEKQVDFGKLSLNNSLYSNQNLLASAAGDKGGMLLAEGVADIQSSPYLSRAEKADYQNGFVRTGILNLALNDPERAVSYADKYIAQEEERQVVKQKLADIRAMNEAAAKQAAAEAQRQMKIGECSQLFSLWAEKERGNFNDAEFYVLTAENDQNDLWGLREEKTTAPLGATYQLVRKMQNGGTLSAEEARDAGNYFISAYKQNKLDLETAVDLQNKVMSAAADKTLADKLFSREAMTLADKVLLPDMTMTTADSAAATFMDQKAKLAFEINDVYNAKREILTNAFLEKGGQLTPAYTRRFNQQALRETREEMGLAEGSGEQLEFGQLKRLMKNYYTGTDDTAIWRQFCEEAPYTDDKKTLFKRLAAAAERRELSYPQFDNIAEVEAADLAKGEKFYLRGRLAVKA